MTNLKTGNSEILTIKNYLKLQFIVDTMAVA